MATKSSADTAQTVFAVVGISLGLIPLVRVVVFSGHVGTFLAWIPGTDDAPGRWLVPAAVLAVCVVVIGLLEHAKDG